MTIVIADGQEVELNEKPGITCLCHPGDMLITVPGHTSIDPESTLETARELEQDQWEHIIANENFLGYWKAMWQDVPPPTILAKGNLATRHIAGMILMLARANAEGTPVHIQYPETYLHPAQCQRIMTMIYKIQGKN